MRIDQLPVDDALRSVHSRREGLATADARRRLAEYGSNRIEKVSRTPPWLSLLRQFVQFFSVILWIAAGLAFFAEWNSPGEGMARIGYSIVAVILINGIFTFWQDYRVERALAALEKLLPTRVRVRRDGGIVELPAEDLVVGDVVFVEQGDHIAADCRLIEGFGVRVSTATVTGEAHPQARNAAPSGAENLLHSQNILLAGTSVVSGHGMAVVFATGLLTEFGKIAHLTQIEGKGVSPLRRELSRLSRLIAALAVAIGSAFLAVGVAAGLPFWQDFIFSIGIIVAMVPEGLLTTLTVALALAANRMAKRNVLIRHLTSVETLGSATVICTDKTGTLTENRMRVRELLLGGDRVPIDDLASRPNLAQDYRDFFRAAGLCHGLKESGRDQGGALLGDPMEIALVEMSNAILPGQLSSRRLDEISFDPDRMRQSVVEETPDGPVLFCKGAPESVLPLCTDWIDGGRTRPLSPERRHTVAAAQNTMAEKGLRVLAFASRTLPAGFSPDMLEEGLIFQGLVGLEDPPRAEVPAAIRTCRQAGIKVLMVTGDHPNTAVAIAREIGLVTSGKPVVITGDRLRTLSASQLQLALDASEIVFARVSADQKLRIVESLKNKKEVVAVTGDGVNDAPSLKAAHIGIAMGIGGTDVAKAASDMVLLDDNFASIVHAVQEGRAVFENIRKFLTYVLVHNVAELVPFLAFALFPIPLPLTPIQALAIDMGTDSLAALGLGIERPNPRIMGLPPRKQTEPLMTRGLALRSYLFLGVMEAIAAMAGFFFVLDRAGWHYGDRLSADDPLYQVATGATFGTIIVMQIVNVYLCRSSVRSMFAMPLLDNPLIIGGVALEIALLLLFLYTSWGQLLLGTATVPAQLWLFIAPFAVGMLILEELRKWVVRKALRESDGCCSR